MNINPIKAIYRFNKEAGLLDVPYSHAKEAAYPIEEMLETFPPLDVLATKVNAVDSSPKQVSRSIITLADSAPYEPTEVDLLDKHIDAIVFSFGSIFKLGLTPQEAMNALQIVMEANLQKLKNPSLDSEGKLSKPDNFYGPEERLQKLLDKRGS